MASWSASFDHRSTPNIAVADTVLRMQSSVLIDAPIQEVWHTLTDTSTFPSWNRFVPRVTIREQPDNSSSDAGSTQPAKLSPVLQLGSRFTFHVHMNASSPDPQPEQTVFLTVSEHDAPDLATGKRQGRIVWRDDVPANGVVWSSILSAERVHEVTEVEVPDDEGGMRRMTEVRNWENQVGYLAYVVRWMFQAQLDENFEVWVQDLKAYVEGLTK